MITGTTASEMTGIPRIPDTDLAFGHVDEMTGNWATFSGQNDVPDEAVVIGYQYEGHKFQPMIPTFKTPNSGWAIKHTGPFAGGDVRIWYRMPEHDMGTYWPQPHPQVTDFTPGLYVETSDEV